VKQKEAAPESGSNPGLTLAFGSALAYTCYDVGVRALIGDLSIWGMLLLRGGLGVVVIGILARLFARRLWGRETGLLMAVGASAFLSSVCNSTSLSTIPLYQALMIIYLYPVFTLLLAWPFNGEPIRRNELGLVGLAFFGSLALIWPDEAVGLDFSIGHLIGVAGAFLYSIGQVLIRRLGPGNSGLEPMFYYSLFALVFSLPLAMLFEAHLGLGRLSGLGAALLLAGLGITAQMTGYAALRWIPGFKVGVIGYLELLLGGLVSWLVFSDPMSPRALTGGVLLVLVAIRLRSPARKPK
jgi:drug/metabolite transporter (DMT)-like permease